MIHIVSQTLPQLAMHENQRQLFCEDIPIHDQCVVLCEAIAADSKTTMKNAGFLQRLLQQVSESSSALQAPLEDALLLIQSLAAYTMIHWSYVQPWLKKQCVISSHTFEQLVCGDIPHDYVLPLFIIGVCNF